MLFISGEERGKGLGQELLPYGIENYSVNDLAVNEQNPLANDFYEHTGVKDAFFNRCRCQPIK